MSREDWEIFDLLREERREKKLGRLLAAQAEYPRLREAAAQAGLLLWSPSERHWQVRGPSGEVLVNYWPSTKRQQNGPAGKARTGVSLRDFEYKLRLLCDQFS